MLRPWQRTIRKTGSGQSAHSQRLERWLGPDTINHLSSVMRGWYGPPIALLDVPGSVRVCGDGDFIGPFEHGYFASAADSMFGFMRRLATARPRYGVCYTGFASVSDALSEAAAGKRQNLGGGISKTGSTGVVGVTNSLFGLGAQPAAGAASSAAPGGIAPTSATTGALIFNNPSGTDTLHLTGADMSASVVANSLLLYDRIFGVAKTMNSTSTEAVSGVPSRYQSTTATDPDYVGGNFLFPEVGATALAATAHNWTTCLYTNQAGTTGQTLPSITGNSGAIVRRLDLPANTFFAPLATGDVGVKALTQMQCSAAVATGLLDFVMGHPIGIMSFPVANQMFPFDWLTNRDQVPRIFNSACLALLELSKPATTATSYSGYIYATAG